MDYKRIRPSQVLLDSQNPRLPDGTSNDHEAINRLLSEGPDQMLRLARDLVDKGEGNPAELPILVQDGSKYVVLEGNRRFAALKLLGDPKLAEDESHRSAFQRLKDRTGDPPKNLFCAIADDREEADPWLTLRHTGANDGVGVRVWSAEQTARHRKRVNAPVDSGTIRSIAIADELTEAYQSDTDLVGLIKKVRSEKLTNIGRLFSGVTLTRLQLTLRASDDDSDRQIVCAKHSADELHEYFVWAFTLLDEKSVDAFKNDELRGSLLNEAGDLLPHAADSKADYERIADHPYSPVSDEGGGESEGASGDGKSEPGTGSETNGSTDGGSEGGATTSGQSGENSGRKKDKPDERCLYSEVKLPNLSAPVQRLLKEAKQLPINDNYAVACVLARVILELAVSDPDVLKWSGKKDKDTLASKINACILRLDPSIASQAKRTRKDLVQAHQEASGIGVAYLHQFLHNPHTRADAGLARRFSHAYTPLLVAINEAMK